MRKTRAEAKDPRAQAPGFTSIDSAIQPTRSLPRIWSGQFSGGVAALLVVVALVGLYGSPYQITVASKVAIYAVVILGLTVLVGYGGQISFGHNAFFGIGGYLSALATTSWGLSPLLGVLIGVLCAVVLALVTGYPTLRLRGHFLALGTFAVGLGFYAFAVASPVFNGFSGIGGIPAFSVGSFVLESQFARFWLCGLTLVVTVILVASLRHGRWGRALRTVATDEATAMSVGIDVHATKLTAFIVAAVLASVAGSLYAHTVGFVSPETFSFITILTFFMMLFIGGVGSVWGAVFGSLVVTVIPEVVPSGVATWQPSIFGALLILVLVMRPAGLLGVYRKRRPKAATGRSRYSREDVEAQS